MITKSTSVSRMQLPVKLAPLDMSLFTLTVEAKDGLIVHAVQREFGTSYDVAVGLIKSLQGVITNVFHRLAKAAFLALHDMDIPFDKWLELVKALGLTPSEVIRFTPEQISVYIHQFLADSGEACMTEVIQDRKKKPAGHPDRFDNAVRAMINLIAGKTTHLSAGDFLDSNGNHITKGNTTVRLEVINAIVAVCGSKGVSGYLKHYPVTNALIGSITGNTGKTRALAVAVFEYGMNLTMDFVHGRKVEPKQGVLSFAPKTEDPIRYVRGSRRLAWQGQPHLHFKAALENCNTEEFGTYAHPIRVEATSNMIKIIYEAEGVGNGILEFKIPFPAMEIDDLVEPHEVGGLTVSTKGGKSMYARHGIVCVNRHAGHLCTDEVQAEHEGIRQGDLRLVTVLDYLAHKIIDRLDDVKSRMYGKPENFNVNQEVRDMKQAFQKELTSYCRFVGKDLHDDGVIYSSVDLLPLQVSVESFESTDSYSLTLLQERMARVIHGGVFPDPLRPGVKHQFAVGAAPKSGSGGHVTVLHGDTGMTLSEFGCQPFQHNRVRAQPLAQGMATAQALKETNNLITTGYDYLMPDQLTRCTTLVIASICGKNVLYNEDVEDNSDGIMLTDDGVKHTQYVGKKTIYGPLAPTKANIKAAELLGNPEGTVADLEAKGWGVHDMNRAQGSVSLASVNDISGANAGEDSVDAYSKHVTLIDPAKPLPSTGCKLSFNGTKHVAMHCLGRRYILVSGKRVYVDVIMAAETWVAKKLESELIMGTAALLGQRHFDGTQTPADTLEMLPDMLKARKCRADGRFLMYDENDQAVGYCFASMHRTFVMKEDEKLASSFKPNGMSNSPWSDNLFGGQLDLTEKDHDKIEKVSGIVDLSIKLREEIRQEAEAAKAALIAARAKK